MNSSVLKMAPRAMAVVCSDDELRVSLTDGRWLSVPIAWFPRLAHASPAERADYELLGDGQGIHWPRVDEDISIDVFDIRGRNVYSNSYKNNGLFNENIQLSSLDAGVYLVSIKDGQNQITKKIIKE